MPCLKQAMKSGWISIHARLTFWRVIRSWIEGVKNMCRQNWNTKRLGRRSIVDVWGNFRRGGVWNWPLNTEKSGMLFLDVIIKKARLFAELEIFH